MELYMKKKRHYFFIFTAFAGFICITALGALYNVPKGISAEDRVYLKKILGARQQAPVTAFSGKFRDEIATIRAVQEAVFATTPKDGAIPHGQSREPKDLYETDTAYCGDRARVMDKALRMLGLETRYVSLYNKIPGQSFFGRLLYAGGQNSSHALVEVKTSHGWMMVDTRKRWMSLTKDEQPVSLAEWQAAVRQGNKSIYNWSVISPEDKYPLLEEDFYIIYGLYSRHGKFYPPYTPYIPDVNFRELMINFTRPSYPGSDFRTRQEKLAP